MLSKNMQVILDTSSLIRFFTNDMPEKALKVKELLENEKIIIIPDVVFPELEYVLVDQYHISRIGLIKILQFISSRKNIKVSKQVKKAIQIFEKSNLDMADCIIASSSFKASLASFDKDLLNIEEVSPFWK